MKKSFWGIMVFLIALLFLAACSKDSPAPAGQDAPGQTGATNSQEKQEAVANEQATVIIGLAQPVLTLDPANYRDRTTESVLRNIFDGLVTRLPDGSVVPMIASAWENPTPTEWIFTIRDDVKFHDGSPLTVEDVVFTFERVINENALNGNTSPRKGLMGPVEKIEQVDSNKVKFVLAEPWPILISMLPHQQIVPKAYLEQVGDDEFAKKPIGAGPFKLKEARLDERIVLERFDEYYDGPVKIKTLVFDVIPENSSRIAALQSGAVHRIQGVTPEMISTLESTGKVDVKQVNGTRVYMLEMNVTKPPFDQVKVRQAMNHAIDMQLIVDKILEGYGTRLAGPMLQEAFALNKDLKPYEYNPEKAKQLLAEAGYPDGFSVVLDAEEKDNQVVQAMASMLRGVGVDAQIRIWDLGVLQPLMKEGERQLYFTGWGNSTQDPYDFLNPKLRTNDRGNNSLYSNARVDELIDKAGVEIDVKAREAMYHEAQAIIYEEAPWVFGFSKKELEAGVKNLQNWEPASDGMVNMHKVYLID